MAYGVAVFLSTLKFYLSPRDRKAVFANLRKILPDAGQKQVHSCAKEVFINFGKYLIEFFRVSYLKKEDFGSYVKIEGIEHIEEALKRGKGAIILSAHVGNWELGGIFMSLLGYPMFAVALPHRHKKVNELFNYQRERLGVVVVPSLGVALRRIFDALKKNQLVALVGDRDFANGGKKMSFLGATKVIPRGPAVLAKRTGASIVPGFMIRQPDDSHILRFLPPISTEGTESSIMEEYARAIEDIVRQYPAQWLMFRKFWEE